MPRKRATKKKAAKPAARVPAAERARTSGFHVKLDAWLAANEQAKRDGAVQYGPHSAERLAKVLSALGEKVNPGTVLRWRDGSTLPESRYVALLERLLGAPWSYLDDPEAPWPRPWTPEAVAELLALLPADRVEDLVRTIQQEVARPPRGASSR
jgi:hypothetical protein